MENKEDLPPRVSKALGVTSDHIEAEGVKKMLDLGCNDGSITQLFANEFEGETEVYGVDADKEAIDEANRRGINAEVLNLSKDRLPFPDEYFDFIISLEVIEHLSNPDNMLREAYRVLKEGGKLLTTTPNLASIFNRLILLLGFQPYNVEVSTEIIAGVPYRKGVFSGTYHRRAYTLRGLKELLKYHGFRIVETSGAPGVHPKHFLFQFFDRLFSLKASWARRLIVLAVKEDD